MKRLQSKELFAKNCPLFTVSSILGKRWTLFILLELAKKETPHLRYAQIKKSLSVATPRMVSKRLAELVDAGLIQKKIVPKTNPLIKEYSLSKKGRALIPTLRSLRRWTKTYGNCEFTENCSRCSV